MNFWCEIKKEKLIYNIKKAKEITRKKIVAVVKGNAYGLGLNEVASIIEDEVDLYGVSSIDEAIKLQTNTDILIMSPLSEISDVHKDNFIYTIDSVDDLKNFNASLKYRVHIYINTGMNRLGILPSDVSSIIRDIKDNYKNISIEGLYTHLHVASNIKKSKKQIDILRKVHENNPDIPNIHCLNSKGIITKELREYASFTNLARAGNLLYGYDGLKQGFQKVFSIKAKVVKRYLIGEDSYIGYGEKYFVKKGTTVGILSCGAIDNIGYIKEVKIPLFKDMIKTIRKHFNKQVVGYFNNKRVYSLCSPNMNCTLVDISDFNNIADITITLSISSIQLDSSIKKRYI